MGILASRRHTGRTAALLTPLAVALTFSLAATAAASDQVPFQGTLDATVTITPIDPPVVSVLIEGAGNATHLGRYSIEFRAVVNQATRTQAGPAKIVLTAANGHTITADGSGGQATIVAPGVLSIVDPATITGGTGRFADATGRFVIRRTFFLAAGMTTGSFEGTISSPGAN